MAVLGHETADRKCKINGFLGAKMHYEFQGEFFLVFHASGSIENLLLL